jgi:hypothetical protein
VQELEVGDELSFVDRQEVFHCLDFQDHGVLHHEVEAVCAVEGKALVTNRDRKLTLDAKSAQDELMREAVLVRRLQKPRPEVAVNFDASADDGFRKPFPPPFLRSSLFHFRVIGTACWEVASHTSDLPIPSPTLPSSLFIPSGLIE